MEDDNRSAGDITDEVAEAAEGSTSIDNLDLSTPNRRTTWGSSGVNSGITMPTFSGKPSESVDEFIFHAKLFMEGKRIDYTAASNHSHVVPILAANQQEGAASWYHTQVVVDHVRLADIESLANALRREFVPQDQQFRLRAELKLCRQRGSVEEYVRYFFRLMAQICQMSPMNQVDRFYDGLTSETRKVVMYLLCRTLAETIAAARALNGHTSNLRQTMAAQNMPFNGSPAHRAAKDGRISMDISGSIHAQSVRSSSAARICSSTANAITFASATALAVIELRILDIMETIELGRSKWSVRRVHYQSSTSNCPNGHNYPRDDRVIDVLDDGHTTKCIVGEAFSPETPPPASAESSDSPEASVETSVSVMAPPLGPSAPGVSSPSRLTRTGSTDASVFSQPSTRPFGGTGSGFSERSSALDGASLLKLILFWPPVRWSTWMQEPLADSLSE
ncbi:unnamed protein product [Phytophthora fragariaefolia]|uniref:Unnamed protein product n=1 Tax=Phytophthora fragariaefolia TaxID=1490495 RepID=A0A9W6TVJ3_9STRA|nr:unnamed protein product [Phytophthora fragariaefolia]